MAIYCVYSARSGTSVGTVAGSVPTSGEWNDAYVSLVECLAAITEADGDTIFVAHDHDAAYVATTTIYPTPASGFVYVLSIDRTNTTTATLLAGAREYTNGNYTLSVGQQGYYFGITFKAGAGGGAAAATNLNLTTTTSTDFICAFEKCTFQIDSNSTVRISHGGASNVQNYLETRNCTYTLGSVNQQIQPTGSSTFCRIINPTMSGSVATTPFRVSTGGGKMFITGGDFSASTNLLDVSIDDSPPYFEFSRCKVPATITTGTHQGIGACVVELHSCASGDSVIDYYFQDGSGVIQQSTSIYLTTGGSQMKQADGTLTSYSLEANPSTAASKAFPLYTPWVSKFVGSTGSKTFSMKLAYDNATALKDTECWIEVEYYKNTADPLSSAEVSAPLVSGTLSRDILAAGSNISDTSASWTGTGGWANKKTATLSKTVTVNQQGYVRCRIGLAKDQTTYVDQVIGVA